MQPVSGRMIPNFLKAQSPTALRLAMLQNNARKGKHFQYFDINFIQEPSRKPYWIAWFFEEVNLENAENIDKEIVNGSVS